MTIHKGPVNTEKPAYEWVFDMDKGQLDVEGHCCGDTFSDDQLLNLYFVLQEHFKELP